LAVDVAMGPRGAPLAFVVPIVRLSYTSSAAVNTASAWPGADYRWTAGPVFWKTGWSMKGSSKSHGMVIAFG